ncbi:hypothetical protein SteCoe_13296 [Stentor coeruleus]|uniref:IST1 homolog n=1 Tax=Stentor coeruleus TaxID=5963 RepID=A0A1R2C4L5_9CILI|nr:hypothetical protein SteCoe_15008 [Stentor coeruleus]OMJ85386.1 hypothetical protein SteCoe_13296 [Stentor coeruleus]
MGNTGIQFNQSQLKANLQMGISRLNLMKNKRINQISIAKDEIATLLHNGKEEMAMVKVESIINHENFITAVEVLIMFCAQLNERVFQIASASKCPPDLNITIETIIWASTKIDSKELVEVRQNLGAKFGFEFCRNAAENRDGQVNSIIRDKLVNTVPDEETKVIKIQEIASEKRIDFVFKHHIRQEIQNSHMPPPSQGGFSQANNFPPPNNFPPSNNFPPPSNFPPPNNFQEGNFPPTNNFPPPSNFPPEPPRNEIPPPVKFEAPPSVPNPNYQDFDIDSLEERFKRLK